MRDYVIGLVFNEQADRIVLTCKDRPAKLAGKINGLGGKLEPGEDMLMAVSREVQQESGLLIAASQWQQCAELCDTTSRVYVLRAFTPLARQACRQPNESEKIHYWRVQDSRIAARGVADMPRLIEHALNRHNHIILRLDTSVRLAA